MRAKLMFHINATSQMFCQLAISTQLKQPSSQSVKAVFQLSRRGSQEPVEFGLQLLEAVRQFADGGVGGARRLQLHLVTRHAVEARRHERASARQRDTGPLTI